MLKAIKRILIALVIIGVIAGGVYLYFNTDLLRIHEVYFNPNEHMDEYDILRYSGIQKGTPYFEINTDEAAKKLMTHPYVRYATATKQFPNAVTFEIVYRKHFFNIRYSDIVLSLDDQLHVLEVLAKENEGFTIEGFAFDSYSAGKVIDVQQLYVLENIVDLLKLIDESQLECDPLIVFKDRNIILSIGQLKVKFGVGENIESKFNAFINIYASLKQDEVTTGTIDVSSDGLPVYRPFGE